MIKVKYPSDLKTLKDKYLKIFKNDSLETAWNIHKSELRLNASLEDLLTGEFPSLVDIYYKYKKCTISKDQKKELKNVFNYDYFHDKIAKFFMDKDNGFDFHTCHYCNMAYINAYGIGTTYRNHLDFVNHASKAEWRAKFEEKQLPDNKIDKIIEKRPFKTLEEFNNFKPKFLFKKIEDYVGMSLVNSANHFDLDHLLPKDKCPILGLSLFNFVPSCSVCNEKLKKEKEIGKTKKQWLNISPTFSESTLCDDMVIKMIPESSCSTFFDLRKNHDNYRLLIEPRNIEVYNRYIQTFKLQDRYNYHKELALQIMDLKERYPEEKRKEISRLLGEKGSEIYSESQIYEDIFWDKFGLDRCFSKLRNDMLKHN